MPETVFPVCPGVFFRDPAFPCLNRCVSLTVPYIRDYFCSTFHELVTALQIIDGFIKILLSRGFFVNSKPINRRKPYKAPLQVTKSRRYPIRKNNGGFFFSAHKGLIPISGRSAPYDRYVFILRTSHGRHSWYADRDVLCPCRSLRYTIRCRWS